MTNNWMRSPEEIRAALEYWKGARDYMRLAKFRVFIFKALAVIAFSAVMTTLFRFTWREFAVMSAGGIMILAAIAVHFQLKNERVCGWTAGVIANQLLSGMSIRDAVRYIEEQAPECRVSNKVFPLMAWQIFSRLEQAVYAMPEVCSQSILEHEEKGQSETFGEQIRSALIEVFRRYGAQVPGPLNRPYPRLQSNSRNS